MYKNKLRLKRGGKRVPNKWNRSSNLNITRNIICIINKLRIWTSNKNTFSLHKIRYKPILINTSAKITIPNSMYVFPRYNRNLRGNILVNVNLLARKKSIYTRKYKFIIKALIK